MADYKDQYKGTDMEYGRVRDEPKSQLYISADVLGDTTIKPPVVVAVLVTAIYDDGSRTDTTVVAKDEKGVRVEIKNGKAQTR